MATVLERSLYQTDYYAWTKDQATKLRAMAAARVNSTLDLANLAEEVESLGRSDLNTVRSQVRRIIEHLLKLEFSPSIPPRDDWRHPVEQARDEVEDHITASMRPDVAADLAQLFGRARRDAVFGLSRHGERETAKALPTVCPYSLDQVVSHDWTRRTGTASSTTSKVRSELWLPGRCAGQAAASGQERPPAEKWRRRRLML
jgi:hypothetical protein